MSLMSLPPEILDHIGSFVSEETLVSLRRVNRTIEAAVFDRFAQIYFSKLSCCVLDRSRLQRLKRITSTTHLINRIREVSFVLNPFEVQTESSIATAIEKSTSDRPLGHWHGQWSEVDRLVREVRDQSPNLPLLVSISNDLARSLEVSVNLEMTIPALILYGSVHPLHTDSSVVHDVLDSLVTAMCPIVAILVDQYSYINTAWLGTPGLWTMADACETIRRFSFYAHIDEDLPKLESLAPLLAQMSHLEYLELRLGIYEEPEDCRARQAVSEAIINSTSMSNMKHFECSNMISRPQTFLKVLERCRKTLQKLEAWDVCLEPAEADAWAPALRVLSSMPNLNYVLFRDAGYRASGGYYDIICFDGSYQWRQTRKDNIAEDLREILEHPLHGTSE